MAEASYLKVVVVIGAGGMGLAIARRLGSGRRLLLADYSPIVLERALTTLQNEGYVATSHEVDISSYSAVVDMVQAVSKFGQIDAIIHTAGVGPGASNTKQVFEINLLGTANIIDAFLPVASPGTSLVCIASMAGSMLPSLSPELEKHLATAPLDQLLQHERIVLEGEGAHPGIAYPLAKRGNQLRVQAAARAWGAKGARVNSVSPGIIATGLGHAQLDGPSGEMMRGMIERSAARRMGTPDDIANAVAWLCERESNFISGTDILVDGGAAAGRKWHAET